MQIMLCFWGCCFLVMLRGYIYYIYMYYASCTVYALCGVYFSCGRVPSGHYTACSVCCVMFAAHSQCVVSCVHPIQLVQTHKRFRITLY